MKRIKPKHEGNKVCTQCSLELPATEEYFYTQKRPNGKKFLRPMCKECSMLQTQKYYDKNCMKISVTMHNRYLRNKEAKNG
jgi:hypothetical protein